MRVALLEADVALPVVKHFIDSVRGAALGEEVVGSLTPGQALVGVVHRELTKLMGEANVGLDLATQPPAVILMAGLQGSGKTTTSGKLARLLARRRRRWRWSRPTSTARGDRAAEDRCRPGGRRVHRFLSSRKASGDCEAALEYARTHYMDVLIVDTAGRLAIDEEMMREIAELHASLKPVETLFVVDAMQGQDAVNVARALVAQAPVHQQQRPPGRRASSDSERASSGSRKAPTRRRRWRGCRPRTRRAAAAGGRRPPRVVVTRTRTGPIGRGVGDLQDGAIGRTVASGGGRRSSCRAGPEGRRRGGRDGAGARRPGAGGRG